MRKLSYTILLAVALCSCSASLPFATPEGVPGSYELKDSLQVVSLVIRRNGTYSEIIRHRNGVTEQVQSTWKWERLSVTMDNFLLPEGLVSETIFRVGGKEIGRRTKQGTIQSEFSLSPETTLSGKTKLYVDPDAAPAFEKKAGGTAASRN